MKPFLALFRAGPKSLHPHAVQGIEQLPFDYALSWFGDTPPEAPGAAFVHLQKGPKWPGLEQTLLVHAAQIAGYRYVWLPDDDLLCDPAGVARMFAVCEDLGLELAQPALTPDSYFSHAITLQHAGFQLRFTNFVEIMAPVLSQAMLARVLPTLAGNASGYGLDGLWPRMSSLGRLAIIDATPIRHTRPVGGPNHALASRSGLTPVQEDWLVSAGHFMDDCSDIHLNYAGLLQSGDAFCLGGTQVEIETLLALLHESAGRLPMSKVQLTRYLANHLYYWSGEARGGQRYPRAMLRMVLEQALAGTGIRFPQPQSPQIQRLFPNYNDA
ncbi:DUF707 domain-containing protein [Piscinibacter sakaiensis]|uniref:Hypothtical protein n=1 Tax=Piscinibacter sakaiensis TaxID=1547922 RepID=A0A0K8P4R5_PISS1|nr:DUF707 domain-containing protein [Piscinibacter sakaiensis]GAP37529.1 hypothtical protein [Piscinibacter sakaiensis]